MDESTSQVDLAILRSFDGPKPQHSNRTEIFGRVGCDICRFGGGSLKSQPSPARRGRSTSVMVNRSTRLARACAAALAAGVMALIGPAGAHAADVAAASCAEQSAAQTFLRWLDPAWYVPAPDSGVEHLAAGWTLLGGATTQDGNEPYQVGGPDDQRSLRLPAGSDATTGPMCIGVEHPTVRFFARNTGARDSMLRVSVVYRDTDGQWQSLAVGLLTGEPSWAPTPILPVAVNLLALLGEQQAAFRFAPADDRGDWSIDDVYVDPYRKG
jgi:hypothetical protein